ncbi:MAG: glycosyltransferase family 39 protein [Selenomonadaceae bacterium]|nr:glycosyltransferase family 39 protein [Selenomonadaceae bacterium]
MTRHLGVLLLLSVMFFLGSNALPVSDPVEVNYAQTAAEMWRSGDWVSPQIYGNYWYDKPVFFYWELILSYCLFGISDFGVRFFPSLFAAGGVWLTYFFGRRIYDEKTGFWGAVILATSLIYWFVAKIIITDMSLFVFMNGALIAFYGGYSRKKRGLYYLGYFLAALATLTKGPIGLGMPGLIILLYLALRHDLGELKRLKIFSGMLIFLAVAAPWYWQMYALHGEDFTGTFFGVHNVLRATVSEHEKWNHWYFYLTIWFLGMLPWSVGVVKTAVTKMWAERRVGRELLPRLRRFWAELSPATQFLIVWAVFVNAFFQCMATKYPTYSLPAFLPLALLTARWLAPYGQMKKICAGVGVGLCLLVTSVLGFQLWQDGHFAGKHIAAAVKQEASADYLLVSVGDYPASVVYYTGHPMYALESREAIAAKKTKTMTWDSKNVMPFMAKEDLPSKGSVYLVLEEHAFKRFPTEFKEEEWQFITEWPPNKPKLKLYRHSPTS